MSTNVQVALCVVLLVGAGLFVESMRRVRETDLGLDVDHMLEARLELRDATVPDADALALYDDAVRRVATLPRVRAATHAEGLVGFAMTGALEVPGVDSIPALPGGGPFVREVAPGFFEATGIEIRRGRPIEASDAGRAVVVNETMARTLWPGADPLGRCLLLWREAECTPVVGVAEDAAREGYGDLPSMEYYVPTPEDAGVLARAVYVRTDGRPEVLRAEVARLLRTFSPEVRNARVRTLVEVLDPEVRAWRMGAVLFTAFGLLATTLAALGLYAALAFDVQRRRRELGVRSALGAGNRRLLAGVVRRGLGLTGVGLALGLGAAWWTAPRIAGFLYETEARDPGVLAGVGLAMLAVTVAGSLLPGVRATRVDPAETLRSE